jgi:hypothetical protein
LSKYADSVNEVSGGFKKAIICYPENILEEFVKLVLVKYLVGLALCPQATMHTNEYFHSETLNIGKARINLSANSSEPNFSSEILWDADGVVTLQRKGKSPIVLGQGVRPAKSEACNVYPFELSDSVEFSLQTKKGLPYLHCDADTGCSVVHPRMDTLTIKARGEKIVYRGNWG